jgi:putative ABC transport system permease protein
MYLQMVIVFQGVLNAVIGFCIAAAMGLVIVQATAETALPLVMTPGLMLALFGLTVVMCVLSATSAIVQVMRIDPVTVFTR